MKEYLLQLAEAKAKEIQTGINEVKGILGKPPASLASYVDYVAKVEECNGKKEALEKMKKHQLEDMKTALSKYKSKEEGYGNVNTTSLQSKIESLTAELQEVAQIILTSKSNITEERESNVEDLQKKVVEEQEKVQSLIEKVSNDTLTSADTPAKEALDEAAKIKKKFDESVKRLSQYKGYLSTLELPNTPIPEIE